MKAENYTSVCWHCALIYKANRSTSRFCNNKHRSLYNKYGSRINPLVLDIHGEWTDADEKLSRIDYNTAKVQKHGWSYCYNLESIRYKYGYLGPLPKGNEILIVGSFAIIKDISQLDHVTEYYAVKHISKLTLEERASRLIQRG